MKVGIFRNDTGGSDYYRAKLPIYAAFHNQQVQFLEIWLNNIYHEIKGQSGRFNEVIGSDIFLLQRLGGVDLIKKMKELIATNNGHSKIVIDHDDDLFSTSPLSAHYADNGTEEIKIVHNGKLIHEWKDGKDGFDVKLNRFRMEQVKKTLALADMITVTNETLANVFREYNGNVKVLPNMVDINEWQRLNIVRKNPDEIRLGWMGGQSHWEDLFMIRDVLKEVVNKNKNVKLVMCGWKPVSMEKDFLPEQFEFHGWVDTAAHSYRMATLDLDIGLIPIKDNQFNRCKSHIKWIEYSALEIPSVSSYLPPYKEIADIDENLGIFVERNDLDGWRSGIEILIDSKQLRRNIGKKARKTVEEKFDINKNYHLWLDAYEEVLNGSSVKSNS